MLNDVYTAALGEGAFGAALGMQNYLCLTYGTAIGGGLVLNGHPYYGTGPSAGIMPGGLVLQPGKLNALDPFDGTYERCASACEVAPTLSNGRAIFERLNEPTVRAIADRWLDLVTAGIICLVHVLNVPCVVLGGGVMEQSYAIEETKRRVETLLIPGFRGVQVVSAQLGNLAGLYGAALNALRREFGEKKL